MGTMMTTSNGITWNTTVSAATTYAPVYLLTVLTSDPTKRSEKKVAD